MTHADLVQSLAQQLATPYRHLTPVLTPSGSRGDFDRLGVDCPFVFHHQGHWWMMYVGFDGVGYRSAYAFSDDLIHWEKQGVNFAWGEAGAWDAVNCAGNWILRENALDQPFPLRYNGRYWMIYHAYSEVGYEVGPGRLGLAWSTDLVQWHRAQSEPILVPEEGGAWEQGGLYKPCLLRADDQFYLFYNAKNAAPDGQAWIEQTGLATSSDLIHWTREATNPVLRVGPAGGWYSKFISDPAIYRVGAGWANAFFGLGPTVAQGGIAVSQDLRQWQIWPEPMLPVGGPGSPDSRYAHKSSLVMHNGVLYHFYCGVRPKQHATEPGVGDEYRTICLATSRPL